MNVCPCQAFLSLSNVCGSGQEPTLDWSQMLHSDRLWTWSQTDSLERLARDQHSSLLRTFIDCRRKKFYNIGPSSAEAAVPERQDSSLRRRLLPGQAQRSRQHRFPGVVSLINNPAEVKRFHHRPLHGQNLAYRTKPGPTLGMGVRAST